jgi:hypothetical protein
VFENPDCFCPDSGHLMCSKMGPRKWAISGRLKLAICFGDSATYCARSGQSPLVLAT